MSTVSDDRDGFLRLTGGSSLVPPGIHKDHSPKRALLESYCIVDEVEK